MNNQFSPEIEQQRLLVAAMVMTYEALADDAMPFTCFKCGKGCEDWDGDVCETCGEFHCDDCLVDAVQSMAPECCYACAHEAAAMEETYRTLQRPD